MLMINPLNPLAVLCAHCGSKLPDPFPAHRVVQYVNDYQNQETTGR